jgi:hypothetical protein
MGSGQSHGREKNRSPAHQIARVVLVVLSLRGAVCEARGGPLPRREEGFAVERAV